MHDLLQALKAAAEPTRLRILAVLGHNELTVNELCAVLSQSQPRVSRHLKLLCDANLLVRHTEGTRAFFRLSPTATGLPGVGRQLVDAVAELIDDTDPVIERDFGRLAAVRADRAAAAAAYFASIASDWDVIRDLHVADAVVETAMIDAIDGRIGRLLDIGTGTARVLEVFADRIDEGIGIDLSREMLNLARTRLTDKGLRHCLVRQGNACDLDITPASVDVTVLHHLLHFLDDPAAVVSSAARTLRSGGTALIVDFGPHDVEAMRTDFAHRRLGFGDEEITRWCEHAGLDVTSILRFPKDTATSNQSLTVTMWVATRRSDPTPLRQPGRPLRNNDRVTTTTSAPIEAAS